MHTDQLKTQSNLFDRIDIWRGVLAYIVCVCHCFQLISPIEWRNDRLMSILGDCAHFSVLAFFFLSGYVIFFSLKQKSKNNLQIKFKAFLTSRVSRIYPPLIASIFLCYLFKFVYSYLSISNNKIYCFNFSYQEVLTYLFMIKPSLGQVNAPLWSLILEWWFYFVGFVVFKIITTKKKTFLFFALILMCLLVFQCYRVNTGFASYLLTWLLGALFSYFNTTKKSLKALLFFGMVSLFMAILFREYFFKKPVSDVWQLKLLFVFAFIGVLNFIPISPFFKRASSYSYSLYIYHYPTFLFVTGIEYYYDLNRYSILIFFCVLFFVIIGSIFLSRIFEKKEALLIFFKKNNFQRS